MRFPTSISQSRSRSRGVGQAASGTPYQRIGGPSAIIFRILAVDYHVLDACLHIYV